MRTKKICVTGGSGFIGTNLIELLLNKHVNVLNLDIAAPRNVSHMSLWRECDILDYNYLQEVLLEFEPDVIIHLAARTDLKGSQLADYIVNIDGVENVVKAANTIHSLTRLIFTSSLLVCELGDIPSSDLHFSPDTTYGESKVIGEQIIRNHSAEHLHWTILRPTSIWGPWFTAPYRDFFDLVLSSNYFQPSGISPLRTFGYVGNTVNQIYAVIFGNEFSRSVKYLGDTPALSVAQWANDISAVAGVSQPKRIPYAFILVASIIGSVVCRFIKFPLNIRRLKKHVNKSSI